MPVETPSYAQWTVAEVSDYICSHLTKHHPELVDEVETSLVAEKFDGKALAGAVADAAKWKQAMRLLIPNFAEATEKWLACIPVKLGLCNDLVFDEVAAARRDLLSDAHFAEGDLWCEDKAGEPYYCPGGWVRYGLTPHNLPEGEDVFKSWPVAYHSADAVNINRIIAQGILPEINSQHGPEPVILLSPSIRYASNWVFNEPKQVSGGKWLLTVLQVRVRPGSFRVQPNTLSWDGNWEDRRVLFDPLYAQDELEWLVHYRHPENVMVTGLMVKLLDEHPEQYLKQYFAKRRQLQAHRRPSGINIRWEWNCAPEKTLCAAGPWQEFGEKTQEKIEQAYRTHRTAVFVGHIGHGDHSYYVDLQKMEMHSANGASEGRHRCWEQRAVRRLVL